MLGQSAMHPIIRFHLQGLDQNSMHATREIDLGCRTSSRFFSLPAPNRWNFNKGKLLDPCSPISLRLILTGTKLPNPAMPSKLSLLFFGWSAVISYICLCSENSTAQPNTPNTNIYIYIIPYTHIFESISYTSFGWISSQTQNNKFNATHGLKEAPSGSLRWWGSWEVCWNRDSRIESCHVN